MPTLFGYSGPVQDPLYRNIRDAGNKHDRGDELLLGARDFMESLWERYEPYADEHFRTEIRNNCVSRFWEMYLACSLLDVGHEIKCLKPGPDILVVQGKTKIWIEAVATSAGEPTKPDSIPGIRPGQATARPTTEILLRIRTGIEAKFREQYQSHLISGIVSKDDAYIVAVNSAKFGHDRWNWMPPPDIVSAVYPVGDLQIKFDRTTAKEVDRSYTYRAEVKKAKGSSVSTDLFLQEDFRPLSAVLYSCVDPIYKGAMLGDDYVLVHNIKAEVAVQKGLMGRGKEYSATQDEENLYLHVHDWQEPSDSDSEGSR